MKVVQGDKGYTLEFFGELKIYLRKVWDEHESFISTDFLSFLEEYVTVVGKFLTHLKYCNGQKLK